MSYYSRTALRELKKRYLNILKKCFLLNLMAFGMVTLATSATAGEDRLVVISGNKIYTSDVTFEDIEYSGYDGGGAIYNYNSSSKITFNGDATFTNNSASSGGAIYNKGSNPKITFNGDATFTNNSASSGGAIYNYGSSPEITFNGDATFTNNSASSYGGAIWNYGITTFDGDATFTNNSASSSGGAIENRGFITFDGDATFTGNSAVGSGGAIFNESGTSITFGGDATFTGNSAVESGGAIYNHVTITFGADSSVSFSNNTANGQLNDIYNDYGTINILGEVKTDIHLISDRGTIGLKAKDTDGDGKVTYGGSYSLKNTILDISGDGVKEVTIENLTVSGSSTLKWDAEIKDTGDSYSVASDIKNLTATGQFTTGTINIMGGNKGDEWYDVTYNKSLFTDGTVINVEVDGLYKTKFTETGFSVNFVDVTLPQTLGEVLRSTTASSFDLSQYNLTVDEGETINYIVIEKDLQTSDSIGQVGSGEKIIRGATKEASDTVINANGVKSLFYLGSGDKLSLSNLTISNAKGAIYNNSTESVNLSNVTFTNNSASISGGGAIYNYNSSSNITFNGDATFTNNLASSSYGGAIYNYNSSSNITFNGDATFTNNSASSGGAIRNSGFITFGGEATFADNSAVGSGGAIYNTGGNTITFGGDATFTNNSASTSDGGAIYNYNNSTITFGENSTATFTGNSASLEGGAIHNDKGAISFGGDTTFTNNSASKYGGAIYNYGSSSNITFNDNFLFSGNTAESKGADIYNDYSGTINFAQGEGKVGTLDGGIYQNSGSLKINKTGAGTLILGDGMVNGYYTSYESQFNQSAGLTIAHVDKLTFAKTNTITGGELRVHGDKPVNLKASVSSGAMFTYLTTNASEQTVALPSGLTVNGAILTFGAYTDEAKNAELALVADKKVPKLDSNGEVEYDTNGDIVYVSYDAGSKLLTTGTIDRAKYKLTSDISGATKVIFKDSDVTIASGTYNASYDFENARIGNYNGTITFGEGSSVYFNNNTANGVANDIYNSGTINILGEVKSDIHLVSEGGSIGLKAKDTDTDGKITYTGSYKLTDTTLDLSGDGVKEVTIENLTVSGSSALKWDAEIKDTGDSYTVVNDVLNSTATGQFTTGTINVMGGNKGDEWYDVTYNKSLFTDGSVIGVETDGLYKTKDITNGISINFVALPKTLGEVLRSTTASTLDFGDYVTVNEGETLNYGISEKDLQNGSMGELGSGEKIIRGATKEASDTVINANGVGQIFYLGSGDKLTLENLTIASAKSSSYGGAIYNYRNYAGSVTLNNVVFANNTSSSYGGVIYNTQGTIMLGGDTTFKGNSASSYGGAIYNTQGTIMLGGDTTFKGNSASSYGGAIYNYGGAVTFNGDATFTGNTASSYGGAIYNTNGTITFGEGSSVYFNNNTTNGVANDIYNSGAINILGEVKSDIHLKSSGGTIGLKAKDTDGDGKVTYGGSYNLTNSARLDLSDDGIKEVTIENLSGSGASLIIDALFTKETDGSITMTADKLNSANAYQFNGVTVKIGGQEVLNALINELKVDQSGNIINPEISYTQAILGGNATFISAKTSRLSTTSPYIYQMVTSGQDLTVSATKLANNVTPLEYLANYAGDSTLQFDAGSGALNASKVLEPLSTGTKTILGASSDARESVIQGEGKDLFVVDKEDTTLEMKDLTITGVGVAIDNQKGKVELDNVIIKETIGDTALKNGSSLALKDVVVDKGIENEGILTVANSQVDGVLENKATLTVEDVTVGTLKNSGVVTLDGTNTIVSLNNESEGKVELLSAHQLKEVINEGQINTSNDIALESLTGVGSLTINNATLDVADKFSTQNKIVSNNMKIGDKVTSEIHFADLEIAKDTTLDIKTLQATANTLTVRENATLGITLNGLGEYGTMKAEEIFAENDAKVHLSLGDNFSGGVFDVFKGTKGSGDLEVVHNNVYNVVEVSEGKYSFMTKDTEALQESLGATKEEVTVAEAMTQGTASHETFTKMQSEVLVALQSLDTQTVEKAKEALTALSGRSTSLYQSQATAGFTQLHNVVSQMLMNTAAPVFGHNGGEEPARASVYIKGLYDRVNSLTGDGFRMRSKGAVLGVQSALTEDLTVGVGYAGIDTTAKEPLRRTEVKTNTGFISAQYQPNNWWVNGVVTYSRSQYDEEKQVLSSTGKANYDVDSIGAQITTGYNIKKGKVIVTPEVGIRYLNAKQEGYQDSLGTTVEATNSDFVTAMAGFKVGADFGWVRPLAGVMVGYDVITDDISSVNTLANGSTYTINGKALDRLSTTVVAGFGMDLGENATLKLEYNGNYRKEYLDHSGMIRLEMKF